MRWLTECSATAVAEAIRVVAPDLGDCTVEMPARAADDDPMWWSATAILGGAYVAKFAWSRPAAQRLAHEVAVVTALIDAPFMPEVVASSTDPLLLVTRRVEGASLFAAVASLDLDSAGRQLAAFLGMLHDPATRARVETAVGELPDAALGPQHPPSSANLRLASWLWSDHRDLVARWCAWADGILAEPRPSVLVHADLHGDNQVWVGDRLAVVLDFETVSAAEPEYDLRAFPGTGSGIALLTATMRHYQEQTGLALALDRVMAWHVRTALGDVLWRSEAGLPLPDHRTTADWIGDLYARLREAGIEP